MGMQGRGVDRLIEGRCPLLIIFAAEPVWKKRAGSAHMANDLEAEAALIFRKR
jgi:hypothetical protein